MTQLVVIPLDLQKFSNQRREDGGLQVPNIEAQLKKQRFQIMQQLIGATRTAERNWVHLE
jgi:hypothetical protein